MDVQQFGHVIRINMIHFGNCAPIERHSVFNAPKREHARTNLVDLITDPRPIFGLRLVPRNESIRHRYAMAKLARKQALWLERGMWLGGLWKRLISWIRESRLTRWLTGREPRARRSELSLRVPPPHNPKVIRTWEPISVALTPADQARIARRLLQRRSIGGEAGLTTGEPTHGPGRHGRVADSHGSFWACSTSSHKTQTTGGSVYLKSSL